MLPDRLWVPLLGAAGTVFAATHAYAFRVILGELTDPDDMRARLGFVAANQTLFMVWVFAAMGLWIVLIALIPAIWRALGRGWPATLVVTLLFATAVVDLAGDGAQFPTLFLSSRYATEAEALRPGLAAGAAEVSRAASALLGPGIAAFFLGSLGAVVVAAVRRPPGGRWYGVPFLLFALANVPVGPAPLAALLNLVFFGGFAYLTYRGLARESPPLEVSPTR